MSSDVELLSRWGEGDTEAGEALFERYYESVSRFFESKLDAGVDDIVQQTFAALVTGRDRIRKTGSFRSYLFGIAHNLLREHYRAKVRDRRNEDLGELSVEDMGAGPSTVLQAKREQQVLVRALRRIPMKDQVILELYYWEKLTAGQIGEVMDIVEDTARSRIRNGKKRLKEAIAKVAEEPGVAESTADDLDGWAERIRVEMR